jgi:hypothetical protein
MTAEEFGSSISENRPQDDKYTIDRVIGEREKIRIKEYFFPNYSYRR